MNYTMKEVVALGREERVAKKKEKQGFLKATVSGAARAVHGTRSGYRKSKSFVSDTKSFVKGYKRAVALRVEELEAAENDSKTLLDKE